MDQIPAQTGSDGARKERCQAPLPRLIEVLCSPLISQFKSKIMQQVLPRHGPFYLEPICAQATHADPTQLGSMHRLEDGGHATVQIYCMTYPQNWANSVSFSTWSKPRHTVDSTEPAASSPNTSTQTISGRITP